MLAIVLLMSAGACTATAGLAAHLLLEHDEANHTGESFAETAARSPRDASHTTAGAYDFARVLGLATTAGAVLLAGCLVIRALRPPAFAEANRRE